MFRGSRADEPTETATIFGAMGFAVLRKSFVLLGLFALGISAQQSKPKPAPPNSQWLQEPVGFKNLKFGTTAAELRNDVTFSFCTDDDGVNTCVLNSSVGEYPVTLMLEFPADRLSSIFGTYKSEDFGALKEIFVRRYGSPHTRNVSIVQNAFGAKFQDETLVWNGKHAHVYLKRYSNDTEKGSFWVGLNGHGDEVLKKEQRKLKQAAKGL
jgi:hypothetical protein